MRGTRADTQMEGVSQAPNGCRETVVGRVHSSCLTNVSSSNCYFTHLQNGSILLPAWRTSQRKVFFSKTLFSPLKDAVPPFLARCSQRSEVISEISAL